MTTDNAPELTRRIIQIALAGSSLRDDTLVALCNDGTAWVLVWGDKPGEEQWKRLTDIPQD